MTDERKERMGAIQARQAARTPGVWAARLHAKAILDFSEYVGVEVVDSRAAIVCPVEYSSGPPGESMLLMREADAALIANAPADIDFLLAEVARVHASVSILNDLYIALSAKAGFDCPACGHSQGGHADGCAFMAASNWLFLNEESEGD